MRKLYRFQPITVPGDDRGGEYSFSRTLSHGALGMSGPKISWAPLPQAQTLATLRDTLLPRLISGQLRLPEAVSLLATG